jgi:hypothetical protein
LILKRYLIETANAAAIPEPIHSPGTGSIQVAFMLSRLSIGTLAATSARTRSSETGFLCKAATPAAEALTRVSAVRRQEGCVPGEGSLNLGNNL